MRKQTKLVAVLSAAALLAIGASMTSFAATRGWTQEGEDWVYLNSDGERESNVWRRSGDNYYYLDEDGLMARDCLVIDDTAQATYYVDENGVRVTNAWKMLPNDEGVQVGSQNTDDTPEVLYYYFGSAGKAYTAGNEKKVREIDGKYYMFNEEGQMLSGWQEDVNSNLYYLGSDREGWAKTGWQQLEPADYMQAGNYDELEYFYFGSTGKASRDKSQYIGGKYYHFNEDGVLDTDWYDSGVKIGSTDYTVEASTAMAFASVNGTMSNGWVYTGDADLDADVRYDNDDMYWYYLVTIREDGKVKRSIPYNYQTDPTTGKPDDYYGYVRAKVIKNKTYIFNTDGKMMTGFVVIGDHTGHADEDILNAHDRDWVKDNFAGKLNKYADQIEGRDLVDGLYYFNTAGGSTQGQMQTGRTAITVDGETFYYYFSKDSQNPGYAYTNAIQDGYLYGSDGKCVVAEDGNSHMVYHVGGNAVTIMNKKDANGNLVQIEDHDVIVSRTGKVKTSGTVTIDGVKYKIGTASDGTPYVVTDATVID